MSTLSATHGATQFHAVKSRSAIARHGPIDVLRMAGVIGVVLFHAGLVEQTIALVGMHALIAAAVYFAAVTSVKGSARGVVVKRLDRLCLPWLLFALIHLAFAIRSNSFEPWMLIVGGSAHLWFVPFIFVVTCCITLANRAGELRQGWIAVLAWASLALGMIAVEALCTPQIGKTIPVWQILDGSTAVLATLAIIAVPAGGRLRPMVVAGVVTLASGMIWLPLRTDGMMWMAPAGLGVVLFFETIALPSKSNAFTDFLGRASFGLFLMHPLVERVTSLGLCRINHTTLDHMSRPMVWASAILTIILSLSAIGVLERTPAKRVVI